MVVVMPYIIFQIDCAEQISTFTLGCVYLKLLNRILDIRRGSGLIIGSVCIEDRLNNT